MKTLNIRKLVALAGLASMLGFGTQASWAQDSSKGSSSKDDSATKKDASTAASTVDVRLDSDATAAAAPDEPNPHAVPAQYAPMLGTDRLFQLGVGPRLQLLYASTFTEAYDTHLGGGAGGGALSAWDPMIGLASHTPRSQYLFQYAATVTHLNNFNSQLQAYHQGTFNASGEFNRGVGWDISAGARYGVDELRLLSGLSFGSVNNVAVANGSNAAFLLGNQPLFNGNDSVGLHWRTSEYQSFTVSVYHSYFFVNTPGFGHFNQIGFNVNYQRALNRKVSLGAFESTAHDFTQFGCNYGTAGGSITLHPTERLFLNAGAGPAFGSTGCSTQRGFSMFSGLTYQVANRSSFYVNYSRQLNAPVLLPQSQSQDNVTAGLLRQLSQNFRVRVDGGFLRIVNSAANSANNGHGIFAGPSLDWQLSPSISLNCTYRHYYQVFGTGPLGGSLGRDQVQVSFDWRPAPRGISK
jgi:hypothetical protein